MYSTIQSIHSYWAYAALILLIFAIVISIMGWLGNKEFTRSSFKWGLYAFIASHVQLLLGLILLFVGPYWNMLMNDTGAVMKDSAIRLLAVEHPTTNIIAIILITIGWSRHKKATTDTGKFKSIAIFYGIGLVLLMSRIPWGHWHG